MQYDICSSVQSKAPGEHPRHAAGSSPTCGWLRSPSQGLVGKIQPADGRDAPAPSHTSCTAPVWFIILSRLPSCCLTNKSPTAQELSAVLPPHGIEAVWPFCNVSIRCSVQNKLPGRHSSRSRCTGMASAAPAAPRCRCCRRLAGHCCRRCRRCCSGRRRRCCDRQQMASRMRHH